MCLMFPEFMPTKLRYSFGLSHIECEFNILKLIKIGFYFIFRHKIADLKNSNGISENIKENIMYNYEELLKRYAEQEIEFILYENNKNKLQRAKSRLDHIQKISKLISKELMNAEIIWILMQIDLDKGKQRNRYDNSEQKNMEIQLCLKRIV